MRKISILSIWLAAFLMAVCFAGCADGNSSSDNSSGNGADGKTETVYKATESSYIYKAVFKKDGTFYISVARNDYKMGNEYEGTYTGDATKDGTITVKLLKKLQGNTQVDYTGPNQTQDIVITAGKFSFDNHDFTRQ